MPLQIFLGNLDYNFNFRHLRFNILLLDAKTRFFFVKILNLM